MIDSTRSFALSPSNVPYPRSRSSPPPVVDAEQGVGVLHTSSRKKSWRCFDVFTTRKSSELEENDFPK